MLHTIKTHFTRLTVVSMLIIYSNTIFAANTTEKTAHYSTLYQSNVHAKYPGHFMNDFLKAFQKKLKSTNIAETELEFKLNFTVNESGKLDNITVNTIDNSELSATIIAIAQSMKKWNPAKENNQAIASRFSVPFYINIAELKSDLDNIRYTATKQDNLFKPANYPTGDNGFWKEYLSKNGPVGEANFVNDNLNYAFILTIDPSGSIVGVEVEGIENKRLKDQFVKDFTKVVTSMKKWNPGVYNGEPIRSKISIPITTRVQVLEDEF